MSNKLPIKLSTGADAVPARISTDADAIPAIEVLTGEGLPIRLVTDLHALPLGLGVDYGSDLLNTLYQKYLDNGLTKADFEAHWQDANSALWYPEGQLAVNATQFIPELINGNDATRGADAAVATDDPTPIDGGIGVFDRVNDVAVTNHITKDTGTIIALLKPDSVANQTPLANIVADNTVLDGVAIKMRSNGAIWGRVNRVGTGAYTAFGASSMYSANAVVQVELRWASGGNVTISTDAATNKTSATNGAGSGWQSSEGLDFGRHKAGSGFEFFGGEEILIAATDYELSDTELTAFHEACTELGLI